MASESVTKVAYQVKLDIGTTAQGGVKTASLNLGKMSLTGFNVNNAYALTHLLEPCLDKSITGEYITRTAVVTG